MKIRGINWGKLSKDETREIIYGDKNPNINIIWKNPNTEELKKEAIAMIKDRIKYNRQLRKRWRKVNE